METKPAHAIRLPLRKKVLFGVVTCVAFFAVLELGGRVIHGWRRHWLDCHRPHPTLGWSLRENWKGKWSWTGGVAQINNQGLRDDLSLGPKQPDEKRLLIVGDSVTFGAGVRTEHTYPARLQVELRQRGQPWRVLNGGVTSYDPLQEADWLELFGWATQPDALAIAFCSNDAYPSNRHRDLDGQVTSEAGRWLSEHSIIAHKLQRGLWRLQAARAKQQGTLASTVVDQSSELRDLDLIRAGYERIAASARAREVPVTLIVFPHESWLTAGKEPKLRRQVRELGTRLGWHVVDLTSLFAAHAEQQLYFPDDPVHPTTDGYALAARGLADDLTGWLRATP